MFEANEVLLKAETGSVPKSWRVFRAQKTLPLARGLQALGLSLLMFVCIAAIGQTVDWLHLTGATWPARLGAAIVIGALVGAFTAKHMKYTLLVVTPDGFVQRTGKAARSTFAVAYRDLEDMKIEVDAKQRNSYTCSATYYSRKVTTTLKLRLIYPDKSVVIWQPEKRFGDSMDIVPSLNEGYVQHFVLKKVWNRPKHRVS